MKSIVKRRFHAIGIFGNENTGGKPDGRRIHILPSAREQAMADFSRIAMLEKALASEQMRTGEHGEGNPLRETHRRLIDAARMSGDLVPESRIASFGERKRRPSGESEVYFDPSTGIYTKIKNPAAKASIKKTSPRDWPYEHILHNILFPDARYRFIGIAERLGESRIVLQQQGVDAESRASDKQVADAMSSMGLVREDKFFFGNELFAVTDVGEGGDNALVSDDGHIVFIDPLIRVKRPVREIIEVLLGHDID